MFILVSSFIPQTLQRPFAPPCILSYIVYSVPSYKISANVRALGREIIPRTLPRLKIAFQLSDKPKIKPTIPIQWLQNVFATIYKTPWTQFSTSDYNACAPLLIIKMKVAEWKKIKDRNFYEKSRRKDNLSYYTRHRFAINWSKTEWRRVK